jgi:arylsulfatase A-like enzyme
MIIKGKNVARCVRRASVSLSLSLISLLAIRELPAADAPKRSNIIVVLVDDMGFSDIGCYGSEIPTPNLDQLAKEGLRFTQFYNTGRCCPTRAALMTGLYSHQAGVGHMTEDGGVPGYQGRLNNQCVTIAEVLHEAGYFTAMTGKWHLGHNFNVEPWNRGFERNMTSAAGGFYFQDSPGAKLFFNGQELSAHDPSLPKNWYTTDLWTDYGLRFIDEAVTAKKPFFLYLAHNAPHYPLQAPAEDIAKFRGKYKMGWDKLREQRNARQIELGVVDKSWPVSPRPDMVQAWDKLSDAEKDHFDNIMAIYAAVISHMDHSIGTLVAGLKKRGLLDDTLIFFLSDNGGNAESGPEGRLEGNDPGSPKSVVYCGQSWATLENTPFRRYKHFNHEGGISTPLIAHWPDGIKAHDELRTQPGHLIDIMATCVDVAGAKYPSEYHGQKIPPMEGRSLLPAFENKPIQRDALFWEHEGNAAVRVGDWKLVRFHRKGAWELYDMKADRTELHDLSAEQPERVKELTDKWQAWAERAHVKPYPNPADAPAKKPKKKKAEPAKKEPADS